MTNTIELLKDKFTSEEIGDIIIKLLRADYTVQIDEDECCYLIQYDFADRMGFGNRVPRWIDEGEWLLVKDDRESRRQAEE